MADTITTRHLDESDVLPVLDLMRAALGEPPLLRRTPELFAWKHFDNPFGRSLAVVAETDDRIVGLRAFMRWDLVTRDGVTLRCVRAVDTATHPDYQRRGIFRRLTEETLDLALAENMDLVFNTPNEKSGAGYLSMGWTEIGMIGVLARPSSRLATDRSPITDTEPENFLADPQPAIPLEVTDRAARGLRTPRNEAYLRWRFGSHPTARYFRVDSADSTAVVRPNVRKGRRELIVADVYGPRPRAALREAGRKSRSGYVAAWFSPGSPERAAAIRSGLVPVPGVTALTLMARPLRELDIDVTSMASWDLAISDLELL
ncbi:MAG: family N-acetyltransferase [Acidimicrobiia bacterium]|nr:family N-acetyltransferase [Acidimicrobiia bacterium]